MAFDTQGVRTYVPAPTTDQVASEAQVDGKTQVLSYGQEGPSVKALQAALNEWAGKYANDDQKLETRTGRFGDKTVERVIQFKCAIGALRPEQVKGKSHEELRSLANVDKATFSALTGYVHHPIVEDTRDTKRPKAPAAPTLAVTAPVPGAPTAGAARPVGTQWVCSPSTEDVSLGNSDQQGQQLAFRRGQRGTNIESLQRALNHWAKTRDLPARVPETGNFGPQTEALVRLFQEREQHGQTVDAGVVGRDTYRALVLQSGCTISD